MRKTIIQTILFLIFVFSGIGSVMLISGVYMVEPVSVMLPFIGEKFIITGENLSLVLSATALASLLAYLHGK